jgi:dimethylhistidine N-methyltransferase
MQLHSASMAAELPRGACWIDLGAGNCEKAGRLLGPMGAGRYVAVDISVDFVRQALDVLQRQHPGLPMAGLGVDFSGGLQLPAALALDPAQPRVLFYPGSSIGNFTPEQAQDFLRNLHAGCGSAAGSGLLIGVDLLKDPAELEAAYDDALGVTAAFDLNLLLHINRLVGSNFAVRDWRHLSRFNAPLSRVEMHLQARHALTVQWPGGQRQFAAGETIHTENACKWTVPNFEALLRSAGFVSTHVWTDPAQRFAVLWATA